MVVLVDGTDTECFVRDAETLELGYGIVEIPAVQVRRHRVLGLVVECEQQRVVVGEDVYVESVEGALGEVAAAEAESQHATVLAVQVDDVQLAAWWLHDDLLDGRQRHGDEAVDDVVL